MPQALIQNQQITFDFNAPTSVESADFPVNIKRSSRRRTIEIIVRNGGVDLMLPQFVSNAEGMAFVRTKQDWIIKSLANQAVQELEQDAKRKRYEDGESFEFLGASYPLRVYLTKQPSGRLVNNQIFIGIKENYRQEKAEAVKKQLWVWYQHQAKEILTKKTIALANKIGRDVGEVKLRRTKTKWGHCTREGDIQYNWQIIVAPEDVVDYLVAHEVSHLVHHNHGQRFWRHVEKLCPNYLEHEKWLKVNGHKINL